jgi:RNA-splicing ligase RtcB
MEETFGSCCHGAGRAMSRTRCENNAGQLPRSWNEGDPGQADAFRLDRRKPDAKDVSQVVMSSTVAWLQSSQVATNCSDEGIEEYRL